MGQILEKLHQGQSEASRQFTLDPEKAREKMRQFQLADATHYVLELIQAATLKGATRIRFDIDADDMKMAFDGRPFDEEDFTELYTSLFTGGEDDAILARRELALGLNAAMALNPSYIRVSSGNGAEGVELVLRTSEDDRIERASKPVSGTKIQIKSRFRPGLAIKFAKNIMGTLPEELIIKKRCAMSEVPIDLEGTIISSGFRLDEAVGVVDLEGDGLKGLAGYSPVGYPTSSITFMKDGVLIATHTVRTQPGGYRAVVDCKTLKKNVSQSDIVRDEAYRAIQKPLTDAQLRSLVKLCDEVMDVIHRKEGAFPLTWAMSLLKEVAFRHKYPGPFQQASYNSLGSKLVMVPFWTTLIGQSRNLSELLDQVKQGETVEYSKKSYADYKGDPVMDPAVLCEGKPILHLPDAAEAEWLTKILDGKLVSADKRLSRAISSARSKRAFAMRKSKPVLSEEAGPFCTSRQLRLIISVSDESFRGELGLSTADQSKPALRLLKDGCFLCEVESKRKLGLMGLFGVLEGPFTPSKSYDGVRRDDIFANALYTVLRHLEPLYIALTDRMKTIPIDERFARLLLDYLEWSTREDATEQFLEAFRAPAQWVQAASDSSRKVSQPALGMGRLPKPADERIHPFTQVLMLRDTGPAGRISLAGLKARFEAQGSLRYLTPSAPRGALGEPDLVILPKTAQRLVWRLFPNKPLENCDKDHIQKIHKATHKSRPQEQLLLVDQGLLLQAGFTSGPVEGELAFLANVEMTPLGSWSVRLLKDRRHMVTRGFQLGLPMGKANMSSNALLGTEDWSDVENDAALAEAVLALRKSAEYLLVRAAESHDELLSRLGSQARSMLTASLQAICPSSVFAWAHQKLHDPSSGVEDPGREYSGILAMQAVVNPGHLTAALKRMYNKNELPTLKEVARRVRSKSHLPVSELLAPLNVDVLRAVRGPAGPSPESAWETVRKDFIFSLQPFIDIPWFCTISGAPMTLADLFSLKTQNTTIYHTAQPFDPSVLNDEVVLLLAWAEVELLNRILGHDSIVSTDPIIEKLSKKQRFLARKEELDLPFPEKMALLSIPIHRQGIEGRIGLARAGVTPMLALYKDHRRLETIMGFCPFGLVAVVNDDLIVPDAEYQHALQDERYKEVVSSCEQHVPELLTSLLESWEGFGQTERLQGRRHILLYLAHHAWRDPKALVSMGTSPERDLVRLPLFRSVSNQAYSILDLAESYEEHGEIPVMPSYREGPEPEPQRRVVMENAETITLLSDIFPNVVDYTSRWDELLRRRHLEQHKAPPLPDPEQATALVRARKLLSPFSGQIWLARPFDPNAELILGAFGLVVEKRTPSALFPCSGVVSIPENRINVTDGSVLLSTEERLILEHCCCQLYRFLLSSFEGSRSSDHPHKEIAWAYLREAVVRMYRNYGSWSLLTDLPKKWRHQWHELYKRLQPLKLFPVDDRELTLTELIMIKPACWEHLGLWFPRVEPAASGQPLPGSPETGASEKSIPTAEKVHAPPVLQGPVMGEAQRSLKLFEAIRQTFRQVGTIREPVLGQIGLQRIELVDRSGPDAVVYDSGTVTLFRRHPLVASALASGGEDPVLMAFLVSSIYTAVNLALQEITDDHERAFHGLLSNTMLQRA